MAKMYPLLSLAVVTVLPLVVNFAAGSDPQSNVYRQYIDHFDLVSHGADTFKQRYWYDPSHYKGDGYPIFCTFGGQEDVETAWNNNGFVHEIAANFSAYNIFLEHRYYGKSLPFGEWSYTKANLSALSIPQAVADAIILLRDLKAYLNAPNSDIVVFGGGYSGLLAVYAKYQHPGLIKAAVTSSAPVPQQAIDGPDDFFFKAISDIYNKQDKKCHDRIRLAFGEEGQYYFNKGQTGLVELSKKMRLCNTMLHEHDFREMWRWSRFAITRMALYNYPYAFGKLPADPVKVACDRIVAADDAIDGIVDALDVLYNSTRSETCYNVTAGFAFCVDPLGCEPNSLKTPRGFQACADLILVRGTNNITDMFFHLDVYKETDCKPEYNVIPRDGWTSTHFVGNDLSKVTNTIFSTGEFDPWKEGCVTKDVSDTGVAIIAKSGQHLQEFRSANKADPAGVSEAREQIKQVLHKWLKL